MNLGTTTTNYLSKMISSSSSMKSLLLDDFTMQIYSQSLTQSQLLQKHVYLTLLISQSGEKMKHLQCICFVRPSPGSVQAVCNELRNPRFGSYQLYFSNALSKAQLERIAEADEYQLVQEVQEFFVDYLAPSPSLFTFNLPTQGDKDTDYNFDNLFADTPDSWNTASLKRVAEGLCSVMLSLKKKCCLRWEKGSNLCRRLSQEIDFIVSQDAQLYTFPPTDVPPLLLLLDRRSDAITPLIHPWHYQSMVHDLLGIQNGIVDMSNVPDISQDLKQVVMNLNTEDVFFRKNAYLDLGDLGANLKSFVDEFQGKHKATAKMESIADMKRFVETYPEFRRASKEVGKHVSVVSEVSRLVAKQKLLELGEVEQNCAVGTGNDQEFKSVVDMVRRADLDPMDRIRLICVYCAKHYFQVIGQNVKQQAGAERVLILVEALVKSGVDKSLAGLISSFCQYMSAGVTVQQPQEDLKSFFSNISKSISSAQSRLRGVDNVYTQFHPRLEQILDGVLRGDFTGYDGTGSFAPRVQDVIVFVVGGVSYEEARSVQVFNDTVGKGMGVRVILGGTTILNGKSFLQQTRQASMGWSNPARSSLAALVSEKIRTLQ